MDDKCKECGGPWDLHKMDCSSKHLEKLSIPEIAALVEDEDEEWDFLEGKTCNPDAPEECESCQ